MRFRRNFQTSPYLYCLNCQKQSPIQVIWIRHWSKPNGVPERWRICGCFMREVSIVNIKEILCGYAGNCHQKYQKEFRPHPPIQGKIPRTELLGWEESEDMKFHVATTGSILDFVGDRVHGWDKSSSPVTRLGVTRIGFGAMIVVSWLPTTVVLDTSGGVLRRGTPASESEKDKQQLHCSLSNRRKLFLLLFW